MKECPNCHNANQYGDYEGPTCEVCMGDGFVLDEPKVDATCRDCGHTEPCDDTCPNAA